MNDATQTLIRSVFKIAAGWLVAKGYADQSTADIAGGGILAVIGIIWGLLHRSGKLPGGGQGNLPLLLCLLTAWSLTLTGCSYLRSRTERMIDPKTGAITEITTARAYTLFDSQATLTRFRNTTGATNWAPGTYIASLSQESSSTNVNAAAGEILGAALKALAAPK